MSAPRAQAGVAALWMIGAIGAFSTMAIAGRALGGVLDTFEIMMYRSFVGVVIVCVVLTGTRRWGEVSGRALGQHMLRNAAHFTGQNLWFYAVTVIPLAQVFALEFTSPLWVILLSALFLKERLTGTRLIAAVFGFVGIVIVARPGAAEVSPGVIAAATAAVFFAITLVITKNLTRNQSIAGILFWLTTMQAVMGIICAGIDADIAMPRGTELVWVCMIGLAGLLAHFCVTNALAIAPASVVVPIDFARLPAIAIVAMLLYGEALDVWVFIGAVIIFAGNYVNILAEMRRNRVA